jgi:hypothetical protein
MHGLDRLFLPFYNLNANANHVHLECVNQDFGMEDTACEEASFRCSIGDSFVFGGRLRGAAGQG